MQRDPGASRLVLEGAVGVVWFLHLVRKAWSPTAAEVGDERPWLLTLSLEPPCLGVARGRVGGASGADPASWFAAQICVLLGGLRGTGGLSLLVFDVMWRETGFGADLTESPSLF